MADRASIPLQTLDNLPNILPAAFETPEFGSLQAPAGSHKPRIYGSLRTKSYSRSLTYEAAKLLETKQLRRLRAN